MAIAYITIEYSDHLYTATVESIQQFADYITAEKRKFKIGDIKMIDSKRAESVARFVSNYVYYLGNHTHSIND